MAMPNGLSPRGRLARFAAARLAAAARAAGSSLVTSAAGLSSRRPRKLAWRSTPSPVNSAKATSATSFGSTQCAPRTAARGASTVALLALERLQLRHQRGDPRRRRSRCRPCRRSAACRPRSGRAAASGSRAPLSLGVQPTMTNSCRRVHLILSQLCVRRAAIGRVGALGDDALIALARRAPANSFSPCAGRYDRHSGSASCAPASRLASRSLRSRLGSVGEILAVLLEQVEGEIERAARRPP